MPFSDGRHFCTKKSERHLHRSRKVNFWLVFNGERFGYRLISETFWGTLFGLEFFQNCKANLFCTLFQKQLVLSLPT
jgi:hypothetical protein